MIEWEGVAGNGFEHNLVMINYKLPDGRETGSLINIDDIAKAKLAKKG